MQPTWKPCRGYRIGRLEGKGSRVIRALLYSLHARVKSILDLVFKLDYLSRWVRKQYLRAGESRGILGPYNSGFSVLPFKFRELQLVGTFSFDLRSSIPFALDGRQKTLRRCAKMHLCCAYTTPNKHCFSMLPFPHGCPYTISRSFLWSCFQVVAPSDNHEY
jgi:hypothetical protein